jgi:RimJ/RimL family protein N-acetyltransferase
MTAAAVLARALPAGGPSAVAAAVTATPTLRRAARVAGRTLVLRDAAEADAAFIVALRTDPARGEHLSATSASVEQQQAWLRRYAARPGEAYFVIDDRHGQALGTVRLYDAQGPSFCWGSWILGAEAPAHAAIESALMVYAYALDHLGFTAAHFAVNTGNERVWAFHERFGAELTDASAHERRYRIGAVAIRASMARYRRFLPDGVKVT